MTGWTKTFFLMMIIHPEIQRRAQEELDAVVGLHRLPTLQDRVNLPYLGAIQKEIYRWGALVPLGGLFRAHLICGFCLLIHHRHSALRYGGYRI